MMCVKTKFHYLQKLWKKCVMSWIDPSGYMQQTGILYFNGLYPLLLLRKKQQAPRADPFSMGII